MRLGEGSKAMRMAEHPGLPRPQRQLWTEVPRSSSRMVRLAEGEDLFAAIHSLLDEQGASGATFFLASGTLASLTLMTGGPGHETPMTFHGPFAIRAPAAVLGGAGITGLDEHGMRTSHCHAAFCDADGTTVGGHLIQGGTIAGPGGISIELTSFAGAVFVRRNDSETEFVVFHPEPM